MRWLMAPGGPLKLGRHGTASSKVPTQRGCWRSLVRTLPDAPKVTDIYSNRVPDGRARQRLKEAARTGR